MTDTVTYSWSFPQIDVALSLDGLSNVVTRLHWRLKGQRGSDTAETYGTADLPAPASPAGFIPLASVTEAQALEWIEGALGEDRIAVQKAAILAELEQITAPSVVAMSPPWTQQEN
jgi:hypothetical protein